MKRIITVASIKGGVGKSVTAIMISKILSKVGKTLLIDLDSQASTTSYFLPKIEEAKGEDAVADFNIYQLIKRNKTLREVLFKVSENLDLIPSFVDLSNFSRESFPVPDMQVKNLIITPLREKYDFIVFDTNPSFGHQLTNAIIPSTDIVAPVPAKLWTVESLQLLTDEVDKIVAGYDIQKKNLFVIETMYMKNRNLYKKFEKIIENNYNKEFVGKVHATNAIEKMISFREEPVETENYYKEYENIVKKIINKNISD